MVALAARLSGPLPMLAPSRGPAARAVRRAGPAGTAAPRRRCAAARAGEEPLSTVRDVIEHLLEREDLSEAQAESSLAMLLTAADAAQTAAFLVLLRAKGETPAELAGLARAMRAACVHVDAGDGVLDIVGTGGDSVGSVNISTGACVLAAAAGARVAKHGNRSVSSLCGSADVIEAMGVAVELGPEGVASCVKETGIGFMYSPRYHPAMKAVVPVRRSLKIRTAFNVLGPLLNPARAPYALVGVYSPSLLPLMGEALRRLGVKKALVVHSMGMDELTPCGPADVLEVTPAGTRSYTVDPISLGLPKCTLDDLKGGDAATNAALLRAAFGGARGPISDALVLNAGVALAACGIASTPAEGVALAQGVQRSGAALRTLNHWAVRSQELRRAELARADAKGGGV